MKIIFKKLLTFLSSEKETVMMTITRNLHIVSFKYMGSQGQTVYIPISPLHNKLNVVRRKEMDILKFLK